MVNNFLRMSFGLLCNSKNACYMVLASRPFFNCVVAKGCTVSVGCLLFLAGHVKCHGYILSMTLCDMGAHISKNLTFVIYLAPVSLKYV